MSKVYVLQRPVYFDTDKKGWVNKYDLSKAKRFGDVKVLLNSQPIHAYAVNPTLSFLRAELRNFTKEDYILLAGDPLAISIGMIAVGELGLACVRLLKFDRKLDNYFPFEVQLLGTNKGIIS